MLFRPWYTPDNHPGAPGPCRTWGHFTGDEGEGPPLLRPAAPSLLPPDHQLTAEAPSSTQVPPPPTAPIAAEGKRLITLTPGAPTISYTHEAHNRPDGNALPPPRGTPTHREE